MKTTEQIKSEVVNYIEKTSKHLFVKENGDFQKAIIINNNIIIFSIKKDLSDGKFDIYQLDDQIKYYTNNTKCVLKHRIFLNKKLKSIRNFKTINDKLSKIKEVILDRTDRSEISKICTQILTINNIVEENKNEIKKSIIDRLFGK